MKYVGVVVAFFSGTAHYGTMIVGFAVASVHNGLFRLLPFVEFLPSLAKEAKNIVSTQSGTGLYQLHQ